MRPAQSWEAWQKETLARDYIKRGMEAGADANPHNPCFTSRLWEGVWDPFRNGRRQTFALRLVDIFGEPGMAKEGREGDA